MRAKEGRKLVTAHISLLESLLVQQWMVMKREEGKWIVTLSIFSGGGSPTGGKGEEREEMKDITCHKVIRFVIFSPMNFPSRLTFSCLSILPTLSDGKERKQVSSIRCCYKYTAYTFLKGEEDALIDIDSVLSPSTNHLFDLYSLLPFLHHHRRKGKKDDDDDVKKDTRRKCDSIFLFPCDMNMERLKAERRGESEENEWREGLLNMRFPSFSSALPESESAMLNDEQVNLWTVHHFFILWRSPSALAHLSYDER